MSTSKLEDFGCSKNTKSLSPLVNEYHCSFNESLYYYGIRQAERLFGLFV